jgi:hypothetical protein
MVLSSLSGWQLLLPLFCLSSPTKAATPLAPTVLKSLPADKVVGVKTIGKTLIPFLFLYFLVGQTKTGM